MPASLDIAALIVVPTALFIVVLRAPHWFTRSLLRYRLWRLRDTIARDMRTGVFPAEHPAVRALLAETEATISLTSGSVNMLSIHVWAWVAKRADPETMRTLKPKTPSLDGLTLEQRQRLETLDDRLEFLGVSTVLLGTWIGIATVIRFVPRAYLEWRRRKPCDPPRADGHSRPPVTITLRVAAGHATTETWLGRSSRAGFIHRGDGQLTPV